MLILSINPKFPIIIFFAILNCFLWSILFTQLYYFGRQKINAILAFFAPLLLLIPDFSHVFFLRGYGLPLGTSFSAISLCIGSIFIILALQKQRPILSVIGGLFFAFAGYIWSLADGILVYMSCCLFFLIALCFVYKLFTQGKEFFLSLKGSQFPFFMNCTIAFLTFWFVTLPYRIYMQSLNMISTTHIMTMIWKLPLGWDAPQYTNNWIWRGGGFSFCRAYPDVCQDLHNKTNLHSDLVYLKQLAIKTFMTDPIAIFMWKIPYLYNFWMQDFFTQNITIVLSFFLITILFLIRPSKTGAVLTFFSLGIFFTTCLALLLTHIELRYFYISKFYLCFAALLSVYSFMKDKLIEKKFHN
ncbi:MAG: hypothetical protein K2Y08_02880 [Alphaproteobacteria bacterium]|nr:hypothetical protein [Alphaproteobacteria bacterium]